jgi:hypothetical protein
MDDFVVNVRQIAQYPFSATAGAGDAILLQQGGIGGSYAWTNPAGIVAPAIAASITTASINITGVGPITWNQGQSLQGNNSGFSFNAPGTPGLLFSIAPTGNATLTGTLSVGRDPLTPFEVATQNYVDTTVATAKQLLTDNSVWTVNGKNGNVLLTWSDLIAMGGAPINSPAFQGTPTSPSITDDSTYDFQIANTAFVQDVVNCRINALLHAHPFVWTFNGRIGDIVLTVDDVNAALTAPGAIPVTTNPPLGDASTRIATTLFVDGSVEDLRQWTIDYIATGGGTLANYAPLNSPNFTGIPTAPTANAGSATGQLATTAFVHAAVTASTTGVASWNTRTGAVVFTAADLNNVGGALLASPTFTGTPLAPTATLGTNTTQIATCAFVLAQMAGPNVASFNTRTGAVTLLAADVTGVGGALLASPTFTGTPAAPTQPQTDNSTALATTAYVHAAVTTVGAGVTSFMGRTGAVTLLANDISAAGGAPIASPSFSGTPLSPTPVVGANGQEIVTAAWVNAKLATQAGVTSFNTRTGAITLTAADVTSAGGALLAGPTFTGVPSGPTAVAGTNTTQLATTAFVLANIGVTSFNTRTGAITLSLSDITGAGGAPLASPALTGTPTAPTAAAADNSTTVATTAFVHGLVAAGAVSSFNGRTGAITLIGADVSAAGGALVASPTFTGVPAGPTAAPGTNTTQLATTAFVAAATGGGYLPLTGGTLSGVLNMGGANGINCLDTGARIVTQVFTIGTAGDAYFVNNVAATQLVLNHGGYFQYVGGTGAAYKIGGGTWTDSSDARVKTVTGDYTLGLDEIMQVKPIRFVYKGNDTLAIGEPSPHKHVAEIRKPFIGFVADDLIAVLPEMVSHHDGFIDGKPTVVKDVDVSSLIYALVNAVKTLAVRVQMLESVNQ